MVKSGLKDARRSALVGSHLTNAALLAWPTRSVSDRSGRPCQQPRLLQLLRCDDLTV